MSRLARLVRAPAFHVNGVDQMVTHENLLDPLLAELPDQVFLVAHYKNDRLDQLARGRVELPLPLGPCVL
jgi:hypothetical protein